MVARLGSRRGLDIALAAGGLLIAALVILGAKESISPGSAIDPRHDPLDIAALRDRASRPRTGDGAATARGLYEFIGRRTWRDASTQAWLLRDNLRRGALDQAFQNADAILREDGGGEVRALIFPMLIQASAYVEARPPLIARLAPAPWWRAAFLQHLATEGAPEGAIEIFADLAETPHPATSDEYAPLINRLVAARDYPTAESAWRRVTRNTIRTPSINQTLDITPAWDHTPFSWSIAEGAGAASDVVAASGDTPRRSLHIDYDGAASPTLPARMIVAGPGDYVLRWRARGDAAGRLFWRVRCADSGVILAREGAAPTSGEAGWREVELRFRTPDGCAAQWIELAANPADRPSPVSVWYSDFQLTAAP